MSPWKQHPEKAPKRSTNPTSNTTSGDETKQTTSQELVLRNHSQANLVASTHIMDPTQLKEPQWLLDTATDFHVSSTHDIFKTLRECRAEINDAGGHTHQITRIGTILVHGIEIPDVRYVPTMKTNLLSF
jgi:hypothetical protein